MMQTLQWDTNSTERRLLALFIRDRTTRVEIRSTVCALLIVVVFLTTIEPLVLIFLMVPLRWLRNVRRLDRRINNGSFGYFKSDEVLFERYLAARRVRRLRRQ